ncbi:hypothetical protein Taro_010651, partial [Colocasia esculenta]|nr:hypothetical protein [Colocasia esculenta]
MGSDAAAAAKASSPAAGKKKKTNRSAKLKQCKLDARREQWLSHVKNKSCKVVNIDTSPSSASPVPLSLNRTGKPSAPVGGGSNSQERPRREEDSRRMGFHVVGLDSQANSLATGVSGNGSTRKDCLASSVRRGSYLRAAGNADEYDDKDVIKGKGRGEGSLDDWEAVADALATRAAGCSPQSFKRTAAVHGSARSVMPHNGDGILGKPVPDRRIPRAWTLDDVFRPRSLPKQHNFCPGSQWYCSQEIMSWAHHGITSPPSLCPICYEDLDVTDSSFLPCSCGFRLCLFCHKKILEDDGRCPGCRKEYGRLKDGEMSMSGGGMARLSLQ